MAKEIKPTEEELNEARKLVNEALDNAEQELPKQVDYTVSLGWTEESFVIEKMDGTSGMAYSEDVFEVKFNTKPDNWRIAIKVTTAHEFAHTWHYENNDCDNRNDKVWQYVLDEAITQVFAERLYPEHSPAHRTKVSRNEISKFWPEIRDKELSKDMEDTSHPYPVYINKGDAKYPNWLGYSMSYLIGKHLLENGYELEDFPDLEKEEVIEAGNKLFT